MTLRAPDAKYALPKDIDRYAADLTALSAHDNVKQHGRYWVLDEWPSDDRAVGNRLRKKLVDLYGSYGFAFTVKVASDKSSVALMVRFDPPKKEEQ